ncbi:ABC transporter family protein (macronuclear) [Tetrahymena thermophila SB210]|uniref:ABC transporter family protein n=1 Tax=Tetrahymena thermophila (strain SB210) TaxID=312017 RepID=I7LT82_TETTS|nr:ABC transporter family protein [Tetrahymena thermophila SB210]EAR84667.2 ABC transporter family protein [Tetrahymena thermophila SB210]|eukprot:XP_001032330.2 ABC transporter family protein [Tetrahymena thermophila SB210]
MQILIVMKKNFKVLFRTKMFVQSLYIPVLCVIFTIISKYGGQYFSAYKIFWPLYQVVAVNGYVRYVMMEIVTEKNEQQKENQKIMGLSTFSYMAGNWLSSIIVTLVLSFIYLIPTLIAKVYEELYFYEVIIAYLIFVFSLVNQVYCLSAFFTNSKLSGEIISIINVVFCFSYFAVYKDSIRTNQVFLYLISLFPQAGISFTFFSKGWLLDTDQFNDFSFTYGYGLSSLAVSGAIYLIIYLYFDQVWPNDYGTQKKPWFFLQCLFNLCKKTNNNSDYQEQEDIELGVSLNPNEQNSNDISSAVYHQVINTHGLKKCVNVLGLTKYFADYPAVNNVSFNLYEGQIFCLLGHNGAGKTTTINLLCGMQKKSKGKIFMNGLDQDYNIEQIRKSIGLCSQKNILYNMLSVEDHLSYYADIKGISEAHKQQDIEYIIQKCQLHNERHKFAAHLSGGNKRKLCLAIALIGRAKMIFLDEPTSGVDPVTRSEIWNILREVKNDGRVIILTTHHLEEAEALADRVCIMAQGQLLALGTVEYITKQFGTGYYLKLTNSQDNQESKQHFIANKELYKQIVLQQIPQAKIDPQSQDNVIRVLLPFETQDRYSYLFAQLEQQQNLMINLQMNSLEDAFVNIGMDEEKYLHNKSINNGQENQIKFSDFSHIQMPQALHLKPSYNLFTQTNAIIKRRFKYLISDWVNLFTLTMPFSFALMGILFVNNNGANGAVQLFLIFVIFSLSFHSLNFVGLTIFEREKNLKYSLRVMGCKMKAYWLGNLLSEILLSLLFTGIFYGFYLISDAKVSYYNVSEFEFIIQIFLLTFATMASSFLYGRMFSTFYEAVLGLPMFMFLVIFWVMFILMFMATATQDIWSLFQIFPLVSSPCVVIFTGLITFLYKDGSVISNNFWLGQSTGGYYVYGIILSIIQIILAVVLDYYDIFSFICRKKKNNVSAPPAQLNDEDVRQEDIRVCASQDPIRQVRVSKTYENGYTAINSISFGVERRQIFGLLGPNGAGKSTSFNILTAKDEEFTGQAFIQGGKVSQQNEDVWSESGICPQFDCLWDHLTPKDHLEIYAALKGLSGIDRREVIDYYLQIMQLEEHVLKKSKNLSGGNKRKLSVCMSLIGGPTIQFFDEPSSGLDPIAKRFLWQTLQQNVQIRNSSIVLTTHSMGEAESLCNKIGILVNGQFACMGSPEHLSMRFGKGYRLTLKLKQNAIPENAHLFIVQSLPQCQNLYSRIPNTLTYQIHESNFVFSQVFTLVQHLSQNFIDDFSLHHADLEQIFQYFAGFQQQYVEPPKSDSSDELCNCKGTNCIRWCTAACCCCVW